ncbi:hypothetical protein ACQ4PT_065121 [Festuca glaucescens]
MATPQHHGGQYGRLFQEETGWYNEMLLSVVLPGNWWRVLPHLVQSWLRNCIGVYLMYFIIGFLWCFVIYHWKQHAYVPKGLASHPVDGILLAMPHVVAPFLLPTHFRTNIALLFMEAIWTANIHDCIHGKVWPVMGAGYHTIHHTTYRHNYGHYTIWMDSLCGTLQKPEDIFKED